MFQPISLTANPWIVARTLRARTRYELDQEKDTHQRQAVAEIIGCSHKTVLKGGAGTGQLTRIRNGTRQVRFILEEVLAHAQRQEEQASSQSKGPIQES